MLIAGAVAASLGAAGLLYRSSSRRILDEYCGRVDALTMDEVSALIPECIPEFGDKLRARLDLQDLDGSARTLDELLCSRRTITLLARPCAVARMMESARGSLCLSPSCAAERPPGERPRQRQRPAA